MIGDETLVPPNTSQPDRPPDAVLSNTATPVFGSATALTSAIVRRAQPLSVCQDCFATKAEQPLPAPLHAVSVQPRVLLALVRLVPPTAVTNRDAAGNCGPKPLSPELAVIATPGWLKNELSWLVSVEDSPPP